MPSCAFLCVYFLSLVSFSAVLHLGMTEELVGAPMSNSQTGATFKQLVDGNRVHFHAGQPAPSSEPAASRTGVPLFFKMHIYFAVLSLLVFNLLLITFYFIFLTKFIIYNFQIQRFFQSWTTECAIHFGRWKVLPKLSITWKSHDVLSPCLSTRCLLTSLFLGTPSSPVIFYITNQFFILQLSVFVFVTDILDHHDAPTLTF